MQSSQSRLDLMTDVMGITIIAIAEIADYLVG